jgi:hypothetical protein
MTEGKVISVDQARSTDTEYFKRNVFVLPLFLRWPTAAKAGEWNALLPVRLLQEGELSHSLGHELLVVAATYGVSIPYASP